MRPIASDGLADGHDPTALLTWSPIGPTGATASTAHPWQRDRWARTTTSPRALAHGRPPTARRLCGAAAALVLWLARPGVAQGPAAPAAQLPPATAVAPLHPPAAPAPSPPPVVFLGRSARAHWAGGVALTVLGAAATGAAVWLTLDSHAAREQARAHCSAKHPNICSPEGVRLQDRVQRDSLAALGVGVAAVPMVGLGLLSLLVAPGNWDAVTTSDAAVQVVPVVGPAPGLALQGTF